MVVKMVNILQNLHLSQGRSQKKQRDYVGKIPKKIAEVIWEDCGGYMEKFQTKSPYNLRNLPI